MVAARYMSFFLNKIFNLGMYLKYVFGCLKLGKSCNNFAGVVIFRSESLLLEQSIYCGFD